MHIRYSGGLHKADEQELPTTCTCPSSVAPIVGDVVSLSSSGNGVKEVLVKDPSSRKGRPRPLHQRSGEKVANSRRSHCTSSEDDDPGLAPH